MPDEIGLFEAMNTQRAIRYFKTDPVPDETIVKLIEMATRAPSGGNRQLWHFLVVRDADSRRRISDYYRRAYEEAYPPGGSGPLEPRVRSSSTHLANNMLDAPVLILACIEQFATISPMTRGASIYPAVQNLLLAARGLGLGSVMTTLHKRYEAEIKELLGIPENVETTALLPIGYPAEGVHYGPTKRRAVEEITYWERWGATA